MSKIRKSFTARDNQEELVSWMRIDDFKDHKLPRPICLANGAFDILHSGHAKILHHASQNAKTVVVALDSDAKIRATKGPERPILSYVERAVALQYMPINIIVEIGSDEDFKQLCSSLNPDFRVKGSEYRNLSSRIPEVPTMWVRKDGMRATKIVQRILERYGIK